MSWGAAQAVGELLAAFGVLASLLYLSAQVRQGAQRTFGETIQGYTSEINALRKALWESEDGARLWRLAISSEPIEDDVLRTRVGLFWLSLYRSAEGFYLQHRMGHLPERLWNGYWTEWFMSFDTPGGRVYFAAMRERFLDPDFVAYVDEQLAQSSGEVLTEFRDRVQVARVDLLGS